MNRKSQMNLLNTRKRCWFYQRKKDRYKDVAKPPLKIRPQRAPNCLAVIYFPLAILLHLSTNTLNITIPATLNLRSSDVFTANLNHLIPNISQASISFPDANSTEEQEEAEKVISITKSLKAMYLFNTKTKAYIYGALSTDWKDYSNKIRINLQGKDGNKMNYMAPGAVNKKQKYSDKWFKMSSKTEINFKEETRPNFLGDAAKLKVNRFDYYKMIRGFWVSTVLFDFLDTKKNDKIRRIMPAVSVKPASKNLNTCLFPLYFGVESENALVDERLRVGFSPVDPSNSNSNKTFILTYNYFDGSTFRGLFCYQNYNHKVDYNSGSLMNCIPFPEFPKGVNPRCDEQKPGDGLKDKKDTKKAYSGLRETQKHTPPPGEIGLGAEVLVNYWQFLNKTRLEGLLNGQDPFAWFAAGHGFICSFINDAPYNQCVPAYMMFYMPDKGTKAIFAQPQLYLVNPESLSKNPCSTIHKATYKLNVMSRTEILYSNTRIGVFPVLNTTEPRILMMSSKRFYVLKLTKNEAGNNIQNMSLVTKSDNITCPPVPGVDISRLFPVFEFRKRYFLAKFVDREAKPLSPYRIRYLVNFTKMAGSNSFMVDCKVFNVNQVVVLGDETLLISNNSNLLIPTKEDQQLFRMRIQGFEEDKSDKQIKALFNYTSKVPNQSGEMVDQAGSQQITLMNNNTPDLQIPVRQFQVMQPDSLPINIPKTAVLGRFPSLHVPNSFNNGSSVFEEDLTFFNKNGTKLDNRTILGYFMVHNSSFEVILTGEETQDTQNATLIIFNCFYPEYHRRVCNLTIAYTVPYQPRYLKDKEITCLIIGRGSHLAAIVKSNIVEPTRPAIHIYGLKNQQLIVVSSDKFSNLYQFQAYKYFTKNPNEIIMYGLSRQISNDSAKPDCNILLSMQKVTIDFEKGNFIVSSPYTAFNVSTGQMAFLEGMNISPQPPGTSPQVRLLFQFTKMATDKDGAGTEGALVQQLYYCGIEFETPQKASCFRKDKIFRDLFFGMRPLLMCTTDSSHYIQTSVPRLNATWLLPRDSVTWSSQFEVFLGGSNLKVLNTICLGNPDIVQVEVYDYAKKERQLLHINTDKRIVEKREREISRAVIDPATTKVYTHGFKDAGYIRSVTLKPGDTLGSVRTYKINYLGFRVVVNSSELEPNEKTGLKITLTTDGQGGKRPLEYPVMISVIGQRKEEFQISAKTVQNSKTPKIRLNEPIDLGKLLALSGVVANLELSTTLKLKNGEETYEFRSRKYKASGVSTAPLISGKFYNPETDWVDHPEIQKSQSREALTASTPPKSTYLHVNRIKTVGDWMMIHYTTEAGNEGVGLAYEPNSFIKTTNGAEKQKSVFVVSFPLSYEKELNMELIAFCATEDVYNSNPDNRNVYFAFHYKQTQVVQNPPNSGLADSGGQQTTTRFLIKVYRSQKTQNSKNAKMKFLVEFFTDEILGDYQFGIIPMSSSSFYLYTTSADYSSFKQAYFTPDTANAKYTRKGAVMTSGSFRNPPSFLEFHNMAYKNGKGEIVQALVGIYGSYQRGYLSIIWTLRGSNEVHYSRWFTLSLDLILQVSKISCKEEVGLHKPKISKSQYEIDFECYVVATGSFDYLISYRVTLEEQGEFPHVYKSSKVLSKLTTPDFFVVEESQRTGNVIVMKMVNLNPDIKIDETIASKCPYILVVYRMNLSQFPWAIYSCKDLEVKSSSDIPSFSLYEYDDVYIWVASRTNSLQAAPIGGKGLEEVLGDTLADQAVERAPKEQKKLIENQQKSDFSRTAKIMKDPKNLNFEENLRDGVVPAPKLISLASEISVHTVKNATLIIKSPSFTFDNTSLTLKRLNQNIMLKNLGLLTSMCQTPFIITFSVNPYIFFPIIISILAFVIYKAIVKDLIKQKILKFLFSNDTVYVDQGEAERSHREREERIERSKTLRKKMFGALGKGLLESIYEARDEGSGGLKEELEGMSDGSGSFSEEESDESVEEEERAGVRYNFEDGASSDEEGSRRYRRRISYAEFVLQ